MEKTAAELKELADKKWDEYMEIRNDYKKTMCEKYKEKYEGQYIKWSDYDENEEQQYMFVYNIWHHTEKSDGFIIDRLYFEGVYFSGVISEYVDNTWFDWSQFKQVDFRMDDFNDETLGYKVNRSSDNTSLMKIISKEEYMDAFHKLIDNICKEHNDFEYQVKNKD